MGARLINFEGIDLAGKGTQAALLAENLTARGCNAAILHFPVLETPVGRIIENFLAGRAVLPPDAVQMLYSANRYELKDRILSMVRELDVLILDRYCPSGWAYGMALGLDKRWLQNLDAGLPKTDLTILLELPLDVTVARKRQAGKDVLERDFDFQGRVLAAYRHLAAEGGWVSVDGRGEADEVKTKVWAAVQSLIPTKFASRET